jgi:hypothetical protein
MLKVRRHQRWSRVLFNDRSMLVEVLQKNNGDMAQTMQAEATSRLIEQQGSQ